MIIVKIIIMTVIILIVVSHNSSSDNNSHNNQPIIVSVCHIAANDSGMNDWYVVDWNIYKSWDHGYWHGIDMDCLGRRLDSCIQKWNTIWTNSQLYIERLKGAEMVLTGLEDSSKFISRLEIQLASSENMPSDPNALRKIQMELADIQTQVETHQGIRPPPSASSSHSIAHYSSSRHGSGRKSSQSLPLEARWMHFIDWSGSVSPWIRHPTLDLTDFMGQLRSSDVELEIQTAARRFHCFISVNWWKWSDSFAIQVAIWLILLANPRRIGTRIGNLCILWAGPH